VLFRSNEFVLDGSLHVDDFFFRPSPFPAVGDHLDVTGILRFAAGGSKITPRDAQDLVRR
jgi:hypothetical protein